MLATILLLLVVIDSLVTAYLLGKHRQLIKEQQECIAACAALDNEVEHLNRKVNRNAQYEVEV